MNNLTLEQAKQQLTSGRAIEQWLGHQTESGYRALKWLRIDKEPDGGYSVAKYECFDDGNFESLDIYSFGQVNPELPYGEIVDANSPEEALEKARVDFKADGSKYLGPGMIQDAYAEFLREYGEFKGN
ncbi:hypothetical protein SAMN02745181_0026 [Rubritalea squalenifaciens DSM 18772]|uniref:Uncharacterized protein n=1 Tax=Rubritalea squalenifaciens DSM 18772 TaxID=1123071 RepID=A0A1M6ASB9_9BACT|nr:hypothetical protein [Rubritalea squalenifaciens]SHI39366.1 hypothetical protein SAMN02745181_0026 [Rubritalea squalenifaciens DSM 18772]